MCKLFDKRSVLLLYRRILILHKGLPPEFRVVGDNYVRDEFKRHKSVDTVLATNFMREWTVSNNYSIMEQHKSEIFLKNLPKI